MRVVDPEGAKLVAAAMRALVDDSRPGGVHVLSEAEGLYRLHISPSTRRRARRSSTA